jgi:hypothetical protein
MADPRLNSVHLEPPRREEFRRARDMLLNARGFQTMAAEQGDFRALEADNSRTFVQEPDQNSPPGLKYWLVDKDKIYPLRIGLNTIGRAPENDVVVPDSYVSRRHCAVLVHAGENCELHDTASKNGTYLNGRRIPGPTRLTSGDEIRMCDRQLVFLAKAGAPELPAHSPTLAG